MGGLIMIRLPKLLVGVLASALLFGLTATALGEEAKGAIRSVNSDNAEVVLKGLFKDTVYNVNLTAKIFLDGRPATLADLRDGDRTLITWTKLGDQMMADEVRCLRKAQDVTGTVRNVAPDASSVTLKGLLSDTTYLLPNDAIIIMNGDETSRFYLDAGDEVVITYERLQNNDLMAIEIRFQRKADGIQY
jgi:hypothetical protein